MNAALLPWTTRGVRYDTRAYLSSTSYTESAPAIGADDDFRADLALVEALPIIYGCKNGHRLKRHL